MPNLPDLQEIALVEGVKVVGIIFSFPYGRGL